MKRRLGCLQLARSSCAFVCVTIAVMVARAPSALATTCTDICPGTGACTIGSLHNIDPGSTLDCSGRDITVGDAGSIKVTDGDFVLLADDLTVTGPGGLIYAVEGSGEEVGAIEISLTGNLNLSGKARGNGAHGGGHLSIKAAGNISIPENGTDGVEADGTSPNASGGEIYLEAGGTISIYDPVHAEGNTSGDNTGGTIDIRAGGDIVIATDGHISVPGRMDGGGSVTIVSESGSVTLSEHIDVNGIGDTGDGGNIEIVAGNAITINDDITANGGVNQGGGTAQGGSVNFEAGCGGISINASITANGGALDTEHDGGSVVLESDDDITLVSGALIDTRSLATGGIGGPVSLAAGGSITINGTATIDARGSTTNPGRGGDLSLRGCKVDVKSGSVLDVRGAIGGGLVINASYTPPSTGTQPLYVSSSAALRATGGTENGRVSLAPLQSKSGECSNSSSTACMVDVDCTIGCQTGDCLYANPDTDGQDTQFDLTPDRAADTAVGSCDSACSQ